MNRFVQKRIKPGFVFAACRHSSRHSSRQSFRDSGLSEAAYGHMGQNEGVYPAVVFSFPPSRPLCAAFVNRQAIGRRNGDSRDSLASLVTPHRHSFTHPSRYGHRGATRDFPNPPFLPFRLPRKKEANSTPNLQPPKRWFSGDFPAIRATLPLTAKISPNETPDAILTEPIYQSQSNN